MAYTTNEYASRRNKKVYFLKYRTNSDQKASSRMQVQKGQKTFADRVTGNVATQVHTVGKFLSEGWMVILIGRSCGVL